MLRHPVPLRHISAFASKQRSQTRGEVGAVDKASRVTGQPEVGNQDALGDLTNEAWDESIMGPQVCRAQPQESRISASDQCVCS